MCGIAGTFGASAMRSTDPETGAASILAHRGPDSFGRWEDEGISLLHWRLAVIDLSPAGHQPMLSGDGRLVLCFNGEIYNFEDLRADIERERERRARPERGEPREGVQGKGRWRGHSDTEVLLEGFALWGPEFLGRLNGMFAIAVFDRETGTLMLARDRAGIKPLYVWNRNGTLLFASEAKFFFRVQSFVPGIDPNGLAAFFTYGHCHDEHHVLEGVRQLEPGEVLVCTRRGPADPSPVVRSTRLCPRPCWSPVRRTDAEAAAALRKLLTDVVARQLVADVPVGVLLSGGVDSSILTALAARELGPDRTMAFTLAYRGMGEDYDELDAARRVAQHLGVRHHVYEASQDDLIDVIERLVWHYDEPFADAAALNVFVLSRMIRSKVTVALAGEGSDELFGGYRRYQVEKMIRGLGAWGRGLSWIVAAAHLDHAGRLPRRVQTLLRVLAKPDAASRYSSYLQGEMPIETLLKPEWRRRIGIHSAIRNGYRDAGGGTVGQLCLVDQQFWLPSTYLEKSDKASMAHGLELRVPFLDNEVIAFANTLPDQHRIRGRRRKWLLWRAFRDVLPAEVFDRFKRGFGVPVGRWLRNELREYYVERVLSSSAHLQRYVDRRVVETCFRDHLRGVHDYSGVLWECLVLEIWLGHFERGFRMAVREPAPMLEGAV
jgi:asparagine synthase (glutamine-hydrolysing)